MLANLVVARRWGVEGTAVWAQSKALTDLVTVLLVIGFPQALVYYLGKYPEMLPRLRRGAKIHSIYGFVICVVIALAAWLLEIRIPGIPVGYAYVALGITSGALVWHSLMRGVAIAVASRFSSSWISSLYAYLIFPLLLFFPVAKPPIITVLMAVAAILSAIGAHYLVHKSNVKLDESIAGSRSAGKCYGDLLGFGALMFVYTVFTFLMPVVTFAWFETLNQTRSISLFSVIIFMIAAITTPVNIIAPYWYTRWAGLDISKRTREFKGWLGLLIIFGAILAVLFWFFAKEIVLITFGEAFVETENVVRWIGLASVVYLSSRLFAALKMSQNGMISLCIASAFRLAAIGYVMFFAYSGNSNALEVAVGGWISGEVIFILGLAMSSSLRILNKADR
jgi:hypothetical protein